MNKISKSEFINKVSLVKEATSIRGVPYKSIRCDGNRIRGIRCNEQNSTFAINVDKLYCAYLQLEVINTSTLKSFVPGVQSPSYAILSKINLSDKNEKTNN